MAPNASTNGPGPPLQLLEESHLEVADVVDEKPATIFIGEDVSARSGPRQPESEPPAYSKSDETETLVDFIWSSHPDAVHKALRDILLNISRPQGADKQQIKGHSASDAIPHPPFLPPNTPYHKSHSPNDLAVLTRLFGPFREKSERVVLCLRCNALYFENVNNYKACYKRHTVTKGTWKIATLDQYDKDGKPRTKGGGAENGDEKGSDPGPLVLKESMCTECGMMIYREIARHPEITGSLVRTRKSTPLPTTFIWPAELERATDPCLFLPHMSDPKEEEDWEHNPDWLDGEYYEHGGLDDEAEEEVTQISLPDVEEGDEGYDSDDSDATARPYSPDALKGLDGRDDEDLANLRRQIRSL